jgi:hypothetical protein
MNKYGWITTLAMLAVALGITGPAVAQEAPAAQDEAVEMQEVDLGDEPAEMEEDAGSDVSFDFVINAIPAALLIDLSGNNFEIEGDGVRQSASSVYMMPNINAGIGMEVNEDLYLDLTVGAGVLVNDSFRAFLVQGALSASLAFSESLNMGPRVGLVQFFSPEWLDDDSFAEEVAFSDTTGFLLGWQVIMGDRIRYLFSIDYIAADFDLDTGSVSPGSDDTLELQGLAVQFGVRGEF